MEILVLLWIIWVLLRFSLKVYIIHCIFSLIKREQDIPASSVDTHILNTKSEFLTLGIFRKYLKPTEDQQKVSLWGWVPHMVFQQDSSGATDHRSKLKASALCEEQKSRSVVNSPFLCVNPPHAYTACCCVRGLGSLIRLDVTIAGSLLHWRNWYICRVSADSVCFTLSSISNKSKRLAKGSRWGTPCLLVEVEGKARVRYRISTWSSHWPSRMGSVVLC